ncbi:hypothetical protein [Treponema medium]|uniref:hypothetical protein n=1 Tax=Treponema medium TaxID=58231 RepID=UPI00197D064B|nr:hypothetical protein [Treponema medium]
MKKYFKTSVFLLLAAVFLTVACKQNIENDPVYTVSFDLNGGGGLLLTNKKLQKTVKSQNQPKIPRALIISFSIGQKHWTVKPIILTPR